MIFNKPLFEYGLILVIGVIAITLITKIFLDWPTVYFVSAPLCGMFGGICGGKYMKAKNQLEVF